MGFLQSSKESEEVLNEVMVMIREITEKIVRHESTVDSCTPILVGSKNENTQCFYPNEYDLFMRCDYVDCNSDFDETQLMKILKATVNDYNCTRPTNTSLSLDTFSVQCDKRFICLHCTWNGQTY